MKARGAPPADRSDMPSAMDLIQDIARGSNDRSDYGLLGRRKRKKKRPVRTRPVLSTAGAKVTPKPTVPFRPNRPGSSRPTRRPVTYRPTKSYADTKPTAVVKTTSTGQKYQ